MGMNCLHFTSSYFAQARLGIVVVVVVVVVVIVVVVFVKIDSDNYMYICMSRRGISNQHMKREKELRKLCQGVVTDSANERQTVIVELQRLRGSAVVVDNVAFPEGPSKV
ncbi:hypothetical protein Tco_0132769 [Tanacetum coccineum]